MSLIWQVLPTSWIDLQMSHFFPQIVFVTTSKVVVLGFHLVWKQKKKTKKWNETYTYMNHSGQEWHKNPTKMMQTFLRSRWKKEKTLGRIDHMTTDSPFWFHAIGETKWTVGQNFEPAGNKNLVSTLVCLVLPKMPTASYKVSKNRRERKPKLSSVNLISSLSVK